LHSLISLIYPAEFTICFTFVGQNVILDLLLDWGSNIDIKMFFEEQILIGISHSFKPFSLAKVKIAQLRQDIAFVCDVVSVNFSILCRPYPFAGT